MITYDGIRDLVTNFVWRGLDRPDTVWTAHTRVTLPYGLGSEEEVSRSKSSASQFTVGSHERKGEDALQLIVQRFMSAVHNITPYRVLLVPNSWIVYTIVTALLSRPGPHRVGPCCRPMTCLSHLVHL